MIINCTLFRRGFFSLLRVATAIGCDDDPFSPENGRAEVPFTVSESTFAPGDTIVATLSNRSDREVGHNLCFVELDRRTSSTSSHREGRLS